MLDKQSNYCLS